MKNLGSRILIAIGIFLVLVSVMWWVVAVPALIKFPDDLDIEKEYKGKMKLFVDFETATPLEEPLELDLAIKRTLKSDADEYDSDIAVVNEEYKATIGPQKREYKSVYTFSRKDALNVSDERANYNGIPVDREGAVYVGFPFDSEQKGYDVWHNETMKKYPSDFVQESERDGLKVYEYEGEDIDPIMPPEIVEMRGLPSSMSMQQFALLAEKGGLQIDKIIIALIMVSSDEDRAFIEGMFEEDAAVPLLYRMTHGGGAAIEPQTGTVVDIYEHYEVVTAEIDSKFMEEFEAVIMKYASEPALEPFIPELLKMKEEPMKMTVWEMEYKQTEEAIKYMVDFANDKIGLVNVVKVYIPWALLIVGAVILIIGLLTGGAPEMEAVSPPDKKKKKEEEE